ncbi:hypothetical protein [Bacillus infantis]|uniref:hypothetical protein n=1 Tax=Bacillus infantis TaxID=324767 RepID=UPI00209E9222|nr:hypothetical protein [Bacillus infantis]MCP1159390.1 hypothetical protein [Bacillus infantis]
MTRKSPEKPLKLAKLKCKKSLIIYGRNTGSEPDKCFENGKDYLFCVDEKKCDIFTYNDVKEVHFLSLNDDYTYQHFILLEVNDAEEFGLDEFTLNRMKRLNKDRYDFED